MESSSSAIYKGKEVVLEQMQILDDDRSNSIETNDKLPIQFESIPKDFLVNMAFTLPVMFRTKKGQSLVITGDIKEEDA